MRKSLRITLTCEVQEGSNVETSTRITQWNGDVTDAEFVLNVALLALAALREVREKEK